MKNQSPAVSGVSRRGFLGGASVAAAVGVATSSYFERAEAQVPIMMGQGNHLYEWVVGWGPLPDNRDYGNTHGGIVVDSLERVYVNTDTEDAVLVFDTDGRFLKAWGQQFSGGLHGMTIVRECAEETLFLCHTNRHEVIQTDMDGQVLMTLPFPDVAGVYASPADYKPTGVSLAPDGSIFVCDGYGQSWVHKYDADGVYVKSWGGRGSNPGQFNTPHGIMVDTRTDTPVVLVADRENGRLQRFDLDGNLLNVIDGLFRRPCGAHRHGDDLVIPDLAGRITLLDKDNNLIAHLGDNPDTGLRAKNGVDKDQWEDGVFIAPHSAQFDPDGNLYVMDWNFRGRVTKLRRVVV